MRYFSLFYLIIFLSLLFSQEVSDKSLAKMVEIETKDGNIFLGNIIEQDDKHYKLETKDGLIVKIPITSIVKSTIIEITEKNGKVLRADPNKSLYIFAPSAFPIESNKSYCRDFCLFFPSYNIGFNNSFSLQLGAFVFPGMPIDDVPLVLSGKYSLPSSNSIKSTDPSFATGIMYVRMPEFGDDNYGFGIAFGTITLGNKFNHLSASLGFGYIAQQSDWEFQEEPIYNFSFNLRSSNSIAIVGESWVFPSMDLEDYPLAFSFRFIGRKIAVDLGGLTVLGSLVEGLPIPIINFTFHI